MPQRGGGRPGLAAITFSPRGGGIAAVSRLLRQVLTDASDGPCATFALSPGEHSFETGTLSRIAFGVRIAAAQLTRRCDWMMYSHLSLATVQPLVPMWPARPYAVFLHDVEAWRPLPDARRRVLAGAFLRLANSRFTARRVEEANPDAGPVVACPLGLPPELAASPPTDPVPFAMGPQAVVIVGRMVSSERYKGHDQLIEAWPRIRQAAPAARLVCVGDGDDVPRLREKAATLGVSQDVMFTGFVSDAVRRAVYAHAAVLAMPSRREGFGLVYLEGMAAGVPCVGSVHDAASEVIVDGVTGYLIPQDDANALVERVVSLIRDEGLRREMGEAGRRRYASAFTYEAFRARVIGHVRSALPAAGLSDPAGRGADGAA